MRTDWVLAVFGGGKCGERVWGIAVEPVAM